MPRKKAKFKCPQCGQSFGLAMHLGRHMSAKHGQIPVTAGKRSRFAIRRGRGRPGGIGAKVGLHTLTLEQLMQVIEAAKAEAELRIAMYRDAMQ